MWRRNESAVTVKCSSSPRRSHAACPDLAHEHLVLRLGRREGREVVLAHERSGALLRARSRSTGRGHQRARRARSAARDRVGEHDVPVRACRRREARVEPGRRLVRLEDGDVVGQRRVERLGEPRHRWAAVGVEARDLPGRMNAGVGPAGDGEAAPATAARRRAPRAARPRPSARPAAAPSRETRSRRTRASASASPRDASNTGRERATPVDGRSRMSNKRNAASRGST